MEILSVTLKNFKAHRDRQFVFQPGTNAICGENGAGKTSILEAIAWTLFNYRGQYKNEDLVCNGAGSAQATVRLISSRDDRTYDVQRCTSRGYTLYDPQLDERLPYKHIEDEIMPWLRQHMGVAPGTDLGRLFANTIGVPQGTFTADFLQPAEKRKPIFDTILKVDEYQTAYRQGLSLEKYAKAEVEKVESLIAQYDERLQGWDSLQTERAEVNTAIAQGEATLNQLKTQLAQLQTEKDRLTEQANQVQSLERQLQQLTAQIDGKTQANRVLEQSLQQAQQAVRLCEQHRPSYQAFLEAEKALQAFDQSLKQRQHLLRQREQHEQRRAQGQSNLARLTLQREQLTQAQHDLDQLLPLVQQQQAFEQQHAELQKQLQQLQAIALERQSLFAEQTKRQAQANQLAQEIHRLQGLASAIEQIPELEKTRDRLQSQLSRIEAAQQFEAELQQLVSRGEAKRDRHQLDVKAALAVLQDIQQSVPVLASSSVESALATIQAGVDLNNELLQALRGILTDLAAQVSADRLTADLHQTRQTLDQLYQQRTEWATLDLKHTQQQELEQDLKSLHTRLAQLNEQLAERDLLTQKRSQLDADLARLNNPAGRYQLLQRQLEQQAQIEADYAQAEAMQAQIQREIDALTTQLASFAELDTQIEQQKQLRQHHQTGYTTYMQQEGNAQRLPHIQAEVEGAIAQLQELITQRDTLQAQLNAAQQTYNPNQWQQVETQYHDIRSQADRIDGALPQQRRLLNELDRCIGELQDIAAKRDRAQADLKHRNQVKRFISFARKVYKEAGPRITKRYVYSVSREADRLFRELLNRPNIALEWTRDYDILVQEGAHKRRFINLSGGEQMCAALAVRLALLRVLADIDIAFFDEPTTNMDRPRRESLAEAIANIRSFRQLVVISHDDTFEKVTENIIFVERDVL
jgi:exonuclease SbcC